MEDLKPIIESILAEAGLGDLLQKGAQAVKGALGLGTQDTQNSGLFNRDEWGRIIQLANKQVNTLANTPQVTDALQVISGLFKIIGNDPKLRMSVSKVHRQFRDALNNYKAKKDKPSAEALSKLVNQFKEEADKVRATHSENKNPINNIANVMSENVRFNNGLNVEEDDGIDALTESLKEYGYIDEEDLGNPGIRSGNPGGRPFPTEQELRSSPLKQYIVRNIAIWYDSDSNTFAISDPNSGDPGDAYETYQELVDAVQAELS